MNRPLVMKFGGTSVADAAALRRLIDHVRTARQGGSRPIVVVSALGGVTNELLRVAAGAASGDDVDSLLFAMRARHLDLASQVSANDSALAAAIADQFDELQRSPQPASCSAAGSCTKPWCPPVSTLRGPILESSCSPTTTTRRRRRSSISST
jgi:aspartokinase